ncbi:MAG TPA: NUDIX domain-containing protein, partial [Rummeliibacillus sp.]|nr:NUDIX domain-containing protein [Rummeliibacillus sp.]
MDAVFKTVQGIFNYRVAGVLVQEGHILTHKSVNDSFWSLPGGRVKILEQAQYGLQREFQEELGVDVQIERLLWSVEN